MKQLLLALAIIGLAVGLTIAGWYLKVWFVAEVVKEVL